MTALHTSKSAFADRNVFWTILSKLSSLPAGVFSLLQHAYRKQATYRSLSELDDHMLRDIGLTRSDLMDFKRGDWRNR